MRANEPPNYRVVTCPSARCSAWALVPAMEELQHRRAWDLECRPAQRGPCPRDDAGGPPAP